MFKLKNKNTDKVNENEGNNQQPDIIYVKRTNRAKEKEIIYSEFTIHADNCTNDEFWETKFRNASYGKFPSGFSYDSTKCLCYSKGSINTVIYVSEINTDELINFIQKNGKIFSETDRITSQEYSISLMENNTLEHLEWSTASDINKDLMLCVFLNKLKKSKNIDLHQWTIKPI